MVIEFLTQEKNIRSKLKGVIEDGVSLSFISQIERKATLIRFEVKESSIAAAKKLEKMYETVNQLKISVPVLDERSQFYHSKLFPLINNYECLLRKLLIVSGTQNKEKIKSNDYNQLMKLECYDLSMLHKLLFTDQNFNAQVKSIFTEESKHRYTKEELIKKLSGINEEPLWDKLFVKDLLIDLRVSFTRLKDYRNIVMHARVITYEEFVAAKKLFTKINKQIKTEIERMEYHPPKKPSNADNTSKQPFVLPNYTENLVSAIRQLDSYIPASKLFEPYIDSNLSAIEQLKFSCEPYLSAIDQLRASTEPIVSAVKQLQKAIGSNASTAMQFPERWKKQYEINIKPAIQTINLNYPDFSQATESFRRMSPLFENIDRTFKEKKEENTLAMDNANSDKKDPL